MLKYWIANAKVSKLIQKEFDIWFELREKAFAIAKEIGAKEVYFCTGFGTCRASGFSFPNGNPPEGFKKLKGTTDGWEPRKGSKFHKPMWDIQYGLGWKISDILKVNPHLEDGAVTFPTVRMKLGRAYIAFVASITPQGCTRLSDLEFERKTGEPILEE